MLRFGAWADFIPLEDQKRLIKKFRLGKKEIDSANADERLQRLIAYMLERSSI